MQDFIVLIGIYSSTDRSVCAGMCMCVHVCVSVCVCVCVCVYVCVWVVVADGCIILIMLDDDACQHYYLLYVCMHVAL